MELVRNCSHFGGTITAYERDARRIPTGVVKVSFDPEGIRALRSEEAGLCWYAERRGLNARSAVLDIVDRGRSMRLDLAYHSGKCGDLLQPLQKNYLRILHALDHHEEIFGGDTSRYSHGDYSIENIVFEGNAVVWVLDWEHFTASLPAEFDLLSCVLEPCYLRYAKRGALAREEIDAAARLIRHTAELVPLPGSCLERPASYLRAISAEHRGIFGPQAEKYPFVGPAEDIVRALDDYLGTPAI